MTPCPVEDDAGERVATLLAVGPLNRRLEPGVQRRAWYYPMAAAVSLAVARAVPAIVLLGHPTYYPKFGFVPGRGTGLEPPAEAWPDAAWMARQLPAWTDEMPGNRPLSRGVRAARLIKVPR